MQKVIIEKCKIKDGCICDEKNENDTLLKFEKIWSSFIDEFYCINLLHREDRLNATTEEFHNIGLCRLVKFYRTEKPKKEHFKDVKNLGWMGCWESHRGITKLVKSESKNVLIFEDDVLFLPHAKKINTLEKLKNEYKRVENEKSFLYYLGQFSRFGYFISFHTLHSKSLTTHAYILNKAAIKEVKNISFLKRREIINQEQEIDKWYKSTFNQYSFYPMLATQRFIESDNNQKSMFGINSLKDPSLKFYAEHPHMVENLFFIGLPLLILILLIICLMNVKKICK